MVIKNVRDFEVGDIVTKTWSKEGLAIKWLLLSRVKNKKNVYWCLTSSSDVRCEGHTATKFTMTDFAGEGNLYEIH